LELELIRLWRDSSTEILAAKTIFELGVIRSSPPTGDGNRQASRMQAASRRCSVAYGRIANRRLTRELGAAMEFAGAAATARFPTAVILCPWRGGDVYGFWNWPSFCLPINQSYGIPEQLGWTASQHGHVTVEDMAAHYVKEILSSSAMDRSIWQEYSMGGLIAFEMARRLHRLGQRVALLALLDSAPIGEIPWSSMGCRCSSYIPRRCLFHFRHWWKLPRRERSITSGGAGPRSGIGWFGTAPNRLS